MLNSTQDHPEEAWPDPEPQSQSWSYLTPASVAKKTKKGLRSENRRHSFCTELEGMKHTRTISPAWYENQPAEVENFQRHLEHFATVRCWTLRHLKGILGAYLYFKKADTGDFLWVWGPPGLHSWILSQKNWEKKVKAWNTLKIGKPSHQLFRVASEFLPWM